jgi:uridine kinase
MMESVTPTAGPARAALLAEVAAEIPHTEQAHVLVGVDGVDGSGKTTFADEVVEELRRRGRTAVVIHADQFLNPSEVRYRRGRHSPDGFWLDSYDYDALEREVLIPLGPGGDGKYRTAAIDPLLDVAVTPEQCQAAAGTVAVVEGLFLHRDRLAARWDYSVFLDVPFAVSARRMADRDGTPADPEDPKIRRYIEGQRIYFRSCRPWLRATRVVDNT